MVVATIFQAIAEIGIGADFLRSRFAPTQDFDKEMIVSRRRDVSELLIGIIPFGNYPEIELLDIPALGGFEVPGTHRDVMAAHVCKGRGGVVSGGNEVGHDNSPFAVGGFSAGLQVEFKAF